MIKRGIPTDINSGLDTKFAIMDDVDPTKVMHIILDDLDANTLVELRCPPTSGTFATREFVTQVESPQYFLNPTYSEITYDVEGRVDTVDIWETSAKSLHLYNKQFTYDGTSGDLTQVVITRSADNKQSQKTITYDSGLISNITNIVIG